MGDARRPARREGDGAGGMVLIWDEGEQVVDAVEPFAPLGRSSPLCSMAPRARIGRCHGAHSSGS